MPGFMSCHNINGLSLWNYKPTPMKCPVWDLPWWWCLFTAIETLTKIPGYPQAVYFSMLSNAQSSCPSLLHTGRVCLPSHFVFFFSWSVRTMGKFYFQSCVSHYTALRQASSSRNKQPELQKALTCSLHLSLHTLVPITTTLLAIQMNHMSFLALKESNHICKLHTYCIWQVVIHCSWLFIHLTVDGPLGVCSWAPMWSAARNILGTKLGSSGRATHVLNH